MKKAMTPIMATTILVVFAIILGIIIMNIGGTYLEEKEKPVKADRADAVLIIDKCYDSGAITQDERSIIINSLG
jgi:uncharacterized membrane protein